ncbi:concanavalin A-like lectin/glucanase domain-containing protein [Dichotomocladium elegans]|nr:concanavalin A-like lectin/glucanase domain-containing protein [Dichotomocladium elegans]
MFMNILFPFYFGSLICCYCCQTMVHALKWIASAELFMAVMLGRSSTANAQQTIKTKCRNIHSVFSESTHGWKAETSPPETFSITSEGLQMNLVPPITYERLIHKATTLPYNSRMGHGPTLNSTTYMHYGTLSATLKSSDVGGTITALIMIADNGDEIDLELIGSEPHTAQTNYFYGKKLQYTVNGGAHDLNGTNAYDDFHTYTIDWTPERIVWSVGGVPIRVKHKHETCSEDGECEFPSSPARIQVGFWDGSFEFGTAQWAHGPIDWEKYTNTTITSYIKEMTITCNPEFNDIVDHLPDEVQNDELEPTAPNNNDKSNVDPTKWTPGHTYNEDQQQEETPSHSIETPLHTSAGSSFFLIPHNLLIHIIFGLLCISM